MHTVLATGTAGWIPVPHTMRIIRTTDLPPTHLTTAAFVFVQDRDDRLLLTHVNLPGRSWDIPGGHIDEGEGASTSAVRELLEETGFALRSTELSVLGWHEFVLGEVPPAWYHYPYPLSYSVSFHARTGLSAPPLAPDPESECGPAEWCTASEVIRRCSSTSWLPFFHFLNAR